MPTVKLTDAQHAEFVARGLLPAPAKRGRPKKGGYVEPSFTPGASPVWVIPLKTVSESNARGWRAKAARTQEARAKVTRALGRHLAAVVPFSEAFHAGRKVRVTFTRLGGGRMDGSNLHAAFKAAEDAVAMIAGADDGAANWRCDVLQEPGGDVGVRIQLAVEGV